jgi:hypothetical protein
MKNPLPSWYSAVSCITRKVQSIFVHSEFAMDILFQRAKAFCNIYNGHSKAVTTHHNKFHYSQLYHSYPLCAIINLTPWHCDHHEHRHHLHPPPGPKHEESTIEYEQCPSCTSQAPHTPKLWQKVCNTNILLHVKLLPLPQPPCAPARTHGQIQAPREPPN